MTTKHLLCGCESSSHDLRSLDQQFMRSSSAEEDAERGVQKATSKRLTFFFQLFFILHIMIIASATALFVYVCV
jgi:hypothetical protein